MQNPVRVRIAPLLGLFLAAIFLRCGRSQFDVGNCNVEAVLCATNEDCNVCIDQLVALEDVGTITADTDCLSFFGDVCSAVDETCDVTNELLVDLAGCLAEDQLGCSGFTSTTCAEATANRTVAPETPAPSTVANASLAPSATTRAPTMMAPTATTGAPTMMAPTATTGAPTMMAPTATTGAPTMMAPTATTGAPTMGPTSVSHDSGSMAPTLTASATPDPSEAEDTETGSNAGARVSSTATAATTLMAGLALLGALFVVRGDS